MLWHGVWTKEFQTVELGCNLETTVDFLVNSLLSYFTPGTCSLNISFHYVDSARHWLLYDAISNPLLYQHHLKEIKVGYKNWGVCNLTHFEEFHLPPEFLFIWMLILKGVVNTATPRDGVPNFPTLYVLLLILSQLFQSNFVRNCVFYVEWILSSPGRTTSAFLARA